MAADHGIHERDGTAQSSTGAVLSYYEPLNSFRAAKILYVALRKLPGAGVLRSEDGGELIPTTSIV